MSNFIQHTKDKNASFWEDKWKNQQTGWDIGYASPAILDFFRKENNKTLRILIPGCGNAYEAKALVELGFTDITLIDISQFVVDKISEELKDIPQIKVLQGDFFELTGSYDVIVEQTFFCALDPSLREQYIFKMKSLLAENGRLVGLLFNRDFGNPFPPFGGSLKEYEALFIPHFKMCSWTESDNSIPQRAGTELVFECLK